MFTRPPWWEKQKLAYIEAKRRANKGKGVCLFADMGTGKALPLDTPILTPTGWTTMAGMHEGVSIIGQDGRPTIVEGVYPQGEQDVYQITFSDGTQATSTLDHLWTVDTPVRRYRKQPSQVFTLAEIMDAGLKDKYGNRKFFIPIVEPVEFTAKPVTLDPYLLGVLLGNGYLRKHSVSLSSGDQYLLNEVREKIALEYVELRKRSRYDYDLCGVFYHRNPVLKKLRVLGLLEKHAEDKFIPDEYLFNSVQVRTEILQGLLDTDGSVSGCGIEYTTASPHLAEQVKFLVQSLGGIVTQTERYPAYAYKGETLTGQLSYRLYLRVPNSLEAFKTVTKRSIKRTKYHPARGIESVEYIGKQLVQCIKVAAPDGLFVINDCIVTHNTRVAVKWLEYLIAEKGAKLIYIVGPLTALRVWVDNWFDWAKAPVAFVDLHDAGVAGLEEAVKLTRFGMPVICLVNYEAAWQLGFKRFKRIKGGEEVNVFEQVDTAMFNVKWDVGILDESTDIKTPGSKVSKFFRTKVGPKTKYRMVMTGSAYTKRPLDVWAQVNFACQDEVFPPTFGAFRSMYAVPHPTIRGAIVGYQNLDDLARRLSKVAILLKKADCFDLPPVTHETRRVSLCSKSQKLYDELKANMYAEMEAIEVRHVEYRKLMAEVKDLDEESDEFIETMDKIEELRMEGPVSITATHVFSRIQKLQQICNGYITADEEFGEEWSKETIRLGHEKVDAVMEVLEMRDGEPTVIVVQWDEEEKILMEAIRKKFGIIPKILNGSVKGAKKRHDMIAEAANEPVFIVKESVAARGVDMRWTDMLIFYSHVYNTEFYEQMLSRNHRGGQTKSITYVHILADAPSDKKVMTVLNSDLARAISIEKQWREYL